MLVEGLRTPLKLLVIVQIAISIILAVICRLVVFKAGLYIILLATALMGISLAFEDVYKIIDVSFLGDILSLPTAWATVGYMLGKGTSRLLLYTTIAIAILLFMIVMIKMIVAGGLVLAKRIRFSLYRL